MTRPQDPAAAGRDQLRAGHADRERVIEALTARTGAELTALTADILAGPGRRPGPARLPTPVRLPCGLPSTSSIRMAWEIPITPGASCA